MNRAAAARADGVLRRDDDLNSRQVVRQAAAANLAVVRECFAQRRTALSCLASLAAIACSRSSSAKLNWSGASFSERPPELHPLQVAQSVVLTGQLIALFDQLPFSARSASRSAHAVSTSAQRSSIVGKGVGRGHGRDYPMPPAAYHPSTPRSTSRGLLIKLKSGAQPATCRRLILGAYTRL
jgi:hypothetical protein